MLNFVVGAEVKQPMLILEHISQRHAAALESPPQFDEPHAQPLSHLGQAILPNHRRRS
jgi:hypothetical protein